MFGGINSVTSEIGGVSSEFGDGHESPSHHGHKIRNFDIAVKDVKRLSGEFGQSHPEMARLMTPPEIRVFVYGTLKPGERFHQSYCGDLLVGAQPAIARGQLFHLSSRGYPAMTVGDRPVRGFVLSFTEPRILSKLDRLEDYDPSSSPELNHYNRQEIEVFDADGDSLGTAWAYFMNSEKVRALGGVYLANGWWEGED